MPLTYLIDTLRDVAIDGEVLWSQGWNILGLAVWLAITFFAGAGIQVGIEELITEEGHPARIDPEDEKPSILAREAVTLTLSHRNAYNRTNSKYHKTSPT